MNRTKAILATSCAIGLALLAWACGGTRDGAARFDTVQGKHPAGWATNHLAAYNQNPDQCRTCHGSTSDPKHAGGTSGVSCFKCHQSPDHPTGWAAASQHGRLGAQRAPGVFSGFANCAKCHGANFTGEGKAPSCKACHTKAPHPSRPWLGSTQATPNHDKTDSANAPECAKCHLNGANSTRVPSSPAPTGTAPGCFNNTLCHDRNP